MSKIGIISPSAAGHNRRPQSANNQRREASPTSPDRLAINNVKPPFLTFLKGRADHGTHDEFKTGSGKYDDVVQERFASAIQKKWYNFDTAVKVASLDRMNAVHTHTILNCKAKVDSSCPRSLQILENDGRLGALNKSAALYNEARRRQRHKYHTMWQTQHSKWLKQHHDDMETMRRTTRPTAAFALPVAVDDFVKNSEKELELALKANNWNSDDDTEGLEEDHDLDKLVIQFAKSRGGAGGLLTEDLPSPARAGMRPTSALSYRSRGGSERRDSTVLTATAAAKFVTRQHSHLPPEMRREMFRSNVRKDGAPPSWRGPLETEKARQREFDEEQRRANPTPRQLWLDEQRAERRAKRDGDLTTTNMSSNRSLEYAATTNSSKSLQSPPKTFYSEHPQIIPEAPEAVDPTRTTMSPSWRNKLLDQIQYARDNGMAVKAHSGSYTVPRNTLCFEYTPPISRDHLDSREVTNIGTSTEHETIIVTGPITPNKTGANNNGKGGITRSPSTVTVASQGLDNAPLGSQLVATPGISRSNSRTASRQQHGDTISAVSSIQPQSESSAPTAASKKRPATASAASGGARLIAGSPLENYKWAWA